MEVILSMENLKIKKIRWDFFFNKSWVSEFTGKINTIVGRSIFDAEKIERIFFYTPVTVLVPNSIMWETWELGIIANVWFLSIWDQSYSILSKNLLVPQIQIIRI